ncbi:MAG TPA: hypothetical protein VHH36_01135, partial [Candidatus Thermoplasmatota archaeon]|nr:hypothetical protein [Candidatus Thermoplasmatota archaeon]
REGPSPFLEGARGARFLAAPPPTAALLRGLRERVPGARASDATLAEPVERVLVPILPSAEGPVSGVTGRPVQAAQGPAAPEPPGARARG